MPLDTQEAISLAFRELPVVQNVVAKINALPPADQRKAVDYAPIFGFKADGAVYLILAEVDAPVKHAVDLVPILGATPDGNFAEQCRIIDQAIEDIKD